MANSNSISTGSACDWLPQHLRLRLVDEAFDAVRRAHTPPPGEPYIDATGVPYTTPADFADDLAFEFRERLLQLVGARTEPYLLERGIGGVAPDAELQRGPAEPPARVLQSGSARVVAARPEKLS